MVHALVATPAFQGAFNTMVAGALANALAQPTFMAQLAALMGTAAANITAKIDETERKLTEKADHTEKKLAERAATLERDMRDLRLTTERLQQQLREGAGSAASSSAAASPRGWGPRPPNLSNFVVRDTGVRTDAFIITGFPPWSTAPRVEAWAAEFLKQLPQIALAAQGVRATSRVGTRCWVEFGTEAAMREALQYYYRALDKHREAKTDFQPVGTGAEKIHLRITTDKPPEIRRKNGKIYGCEKLLRNIVGETAELVTSYSVWGVASQGRCLVQLDKITGETRWHLDAIGDLFGRPAADLVENRRGEVE